MFFKANKKELLEKQEFNQGLNRTIKGNIVCIEEYEHYEINDENGTQFLSYRDETNQSCALRS